MFACTRAIECSAFAGFCFIPISIQCGCGGISISWSPHIPRAHKDVEMTVVCLRNFGGVPAAFRSPPPKISSDGLTRCRAAAELDAYKADKSADSQSCPALPTNVVCCPMASPTPVPSPNLGDRAAPSLFGMLFNHALMGSLVVQIYRYYCAFPNDRTIAKAIVYSIFVVELAQTAVTSYSANKIFGSGYGNIAILNESSLTWIPGVILPAIVSVTVQLFYAYRVHSFSRSRIAAIVIISLALATFISGFANGIISQSDGKLSHVSHRRVVISVWLVSSASCDIAIAVAMTFYLKRGFATSIPMKTTISRIIRYTIATGAMTAVVSLLQIFLTFVFPSEDYFQLVGWIMGKLYSNSLLVLLNTRAVSVGGRNDLPGMDEIEFPTTERLADKRNSVD